MIQPHPEWCECNECDEDCIDTISEEEYDEMYRLGPLWVPQEDAWGCAAATMAMLTGQTYAQVIASIGGLDAERHCSMLFFWGQWLAERGYALAYKHQHFDNVKRDPWPPPPFATLHICEVVVTEQSPGSHSVLMLEDGSVLDPLTPTRRRLADYHAVYFVAGVALLKSDDALTGG